MSGVKVAISAALSLPIGIITETIAILGIRGSGKTNTAVVLTEEFIKAGQQVIIIDPLDVWYGLKSSADGEKAGLPVVIFGGHHADVPLAESDAKIIAALLVENRFSAVVSLRHLSKSAQKRFVAEFCEEIYKLKGKHQFQDPVNIVIDEASSFVPQSFTGETARTVGAIEDLVRRGRSAGIGVTLIDQRAASVHKDVLTQLEVLVAHRHTSPQDRKALDEWIKGHDTGDNRAQFIETLSSLKQGEAWIWSPGLNLFQRVQIAQRKTFDSSKTPGVGERRLEPKALATVDLDAIRERMAATVQEAEQNDPKALRKRIAELEKQVGKGVDPGAIATAVQEATAPYIQRIDALETIIQESALVAEDFRSAASSLDHSAQRLHAVLTRDTVASIAPARDRIELDQPQSLLRSAREDMAGATFTEHSPMPEKPTPRPAPQPRAPRPSGGVQDRILNALAELEVIGLRSAPRVLVAFMSGYSNMASKGFANAIGAAKTAGLVDYPSKGQMSLTDSGRSLAKSVNAPASLDDLHARVLGLFEGAHQKVLNPLLGCYPHSMSREDLAARAGYTNLASKGFTNAIGRLRSLGMIDYPERGQVVATSVLFPAGLK